MHDFSVSAYTTEMAGNSGGSFKDNTYSTRPEDLHNRNIFDYEQPLPEATHNRWLDDYGWL